MAVKKYWMLMQEVNSGRLTRFETLESARNEARRQTKDNPVDILELVERTVVPIPDIAVEVAV